MRERSMNVGAGGAGGGLAEPTYEISIRTRSLDLRRDGSGSASDGVYVPTFMTPFPEELSNGEEATHTAELLLSDETHRMLEREPLEAMKTLASLPVQHFPESPTGPLTLAYTSASGLKISDTASITALYNELFLEMQQAVCKILCKAFAIVVLGRDVDGAGERFDMGRQMPMPGTETPDWWPEEGVEFMSTDRILKVERLRLLCHLLRLRHVTIDRLEAKSRQMLAKTPHLNEEVDEERARRIKLSLDRLFSVAKVEEEFLMGLIGPDTVVMGGNAKVPTAGFL